LPYRNEALYIQPCLKSLANQTDKDFELIAVNDGSDDQSSNIVETFRNSFTRLININTEKKGIVHALNCGLDRASGEIIIRADGDDIYHPKRIAIQRDLIDSGVDIAGSRLRFFPRSSLMDGFKTYELWINRLQSPSAIASEIFVETPIAHPSMAIRSSFLNKIGGYRDNSWPEDFDLMLRAFRAGAVFGKADKTLLFWREHEDRLCRTDPRYGLKAFIECRCHHLVNGPLSGDKKIVLWGAGPIGRKTATGLRKAGADFEAYIDIDPKKIGRTVRDRKVYGPDFLKKNRFFVISCVGKRNARYLVRAELESMGYRDRLDYILGA